MAYGKEIMLKNSLLSATQQNISVLLAAVFFACSHIPATAHPHSQLSKRMSRLAGSIHATAQFCGGYSKSELGIIKQKQKQTVLAMGVDEQLFEDTFTREAERTRTLLATSTDAQRHETCQGFTVLETTLPLH